jgi:uncharacterized RDD family membrane protein YckC
MSNLENDEQSHLDGESIVPDARAGFWRRVASFLVDQALLVSINLLLRTSLAEAGDALALAIIASYYTLLVGSRRGQTLGMAVMRIRVLSTAGPGSLGYGRAFVRWIGGYISASALGLGFLWMLWDKEKQCWHDKLASDVVVPVSALSEKTL